MDPVQRRDLKRPRVGSLDTESDRPPPRPRFPLDTQHQQLIPPPSHVVGSNLSIPSAHWPISLPPNQTYITGGNHFENYGNLNFYHQTSPAAHDPCLERLHNHAASNAIHTSSAVDSQGICMPGTRAFTLQRLQSLVTSIENDDPDIIWMHGPAGSGKSAIVRTIANALDEQCVLLGSFFFFRSDPQRNTWNPFIPTMAFQSFTSCPATQPHIRNAVHSHPNIFSQSIRHQLHRLFETPLKLAADHEPKWTPQSTLVIVIDGLDECADADRQIEVIRAMRQLASTIRSSTNRRVKILIASRPEKPIMDEFKLDKDSVTIIDLTPSDANIDLFYDTRLDEIRRRKNLPESWPSPEQVKWLKKKTSGQYSFAHISTGFLAGGDPVERLKMIENGVGTHGLEPFAALDALYATIFQQIPPEMAENALLLVRIWLVHSDFAYERATRVVERILSLPSGFSFRLLPYLSSMFDIGIVRFKPYHASLNDFLGDQLRASKYSLFLDLPALSTTITMGMLRLCVAPLPLPIDEEMADAWFDDYENLFTHTSNTDWEKVFLHFSPLPSTAAILDQLTLSLPTMDLYAFGYCAHFLSILSKDQPEYHLVSNPSYFQTVRRLLDQTYSIQQLRFATYEALEARGDSGLGLFGLLLLFASNCDTVPISTLINAQERRHSARSVEDIVAYLVQVWVDQDIPDPVHNAEKPLPLWTLAVQLSTAKNLLKSFTRTPDHLEIAIFSRRRIFIMGRPRPMGIFALIPGQNLKEEYQKLSLCLSQTIGMFLVLPSLDTSTQIQRRIQQYIACPDHAELCLECTFCNLALQWTSISVIYSVLEFLCEDDELGDMAIDAWTFARCHHFVNTVDGFDSTDFDKKMMQVGALILDKFELETGTDTSIVADVRTIVSSLHEKRGVHLDHLCGSWWKYRAYDSTPRDDCLICSDTLFLAVKEPLFDGPD